MDSEIVLRLPREMVGKFETNVLDNFIVVSRVYRSFVRSSRDLVLDGFIVMSSC